MADERLIFDAQINVNAKQLEETQQRIRELTKQLRGLAPASKEYQKILLELAKQGKIFEEQSKAAQKFSKNTSKFVGDSVDEIVADLKSEGKAYDDLRQKAKQAADTQQKENDETLKTLGALEKKQRELAQVIRKQGIGSADFEKTKRELQSVNSQVRKLTEEFRSTGAALFSFRDGARTVFRTLISRGVNELINAFGNLRRNIFRFAKDSVKAFADFEKQIDRVGALTGATGEQLEMLSKQARELGASTAFSASEAAQAQQFLAQAGLNTEEIYAALPGTLELAAAGQIDLAKAADIASNVLSGLALPVEDLGRVNDVLAKTASSANTNVSQLGNAFKNVAPTVANAGESIETAAAAIGILGNAGIQGGKAGTDLRNIILRLQAPTAKAADTIKRLGIQTQDAEGNFIGLENILKQFENTTTTTEDIVTIFGTRAQGAFEILRKEGAEGLAAFSEELEKAGGFAAEVGEKQLDNLAGDFVRVQSATEGLQIALGELASGPLREVVGGFAELIGALANVVSGQELTTKQTQTVEKTLKVLGQILAVVGAAYLTLSARGKAFVASLKTQARTIRQTSGTVNKLGVAFKGLGNAIAGIGIGLAIAAIVEVVDNLRKSLNATADITADFEQATAKANVQVEQETKNLDKLFDELKKTEDGTIARKRAIDNLNENYGEYIGNLEDENGQLVDLEEAQRKANKQLEASIRLKATQNLQVKFAEQLEEERIKLEQLEKQAKDTGGAYDTLVDGAIEISGGGLVEDGIRELGFDEAADEIGNFNDTVKRTIGSSSAAIRQDIRITTERIQSLEEQLASSNERVSELREVSGEADRERAAQAKADAEAAQAERDKALAAYQDQIRIQREQIGVLNELDQQRARLLAFEAEDLQGERLVRKLREISDIERGIIERTSQFELSIAGLTANERLLIEQEAANDIIEINRKLRDDIAKIRASEVQIDPVTGGDILPSDFDAQGAIDNIQSQLGSAADAAQPEQSIFAKLLGFERGEGLQGRIEKAAAVVLQGVSDLSTQLFDIVSQFTQANIDRLNNEIENITGRIESATGRVDELRQEEITATGQRREALEREREALQRRIETDKEARIKAEQDVAKEEAKLLRQKKAQEISQAIINTAQSIVATGAQLGYPAAIPFQVQAGAIGAAQIALISAQQFEQGGMLDSLPKFAAGGITGRGGISQGAPHSKGGIKLYDSGSGRVTGEIEGSEVILTKGVTKNPALLKAASDINVAGGGKAFFQAGGTLSSVQSLGGVNTAQLSQRLQEVTVAELRGLRQDFRTIRPVVAVEDINNVQGEVSRNEQRVQVIQ